MKVKSESEVAQSCPTPTTPWTAAYQVPPSMGFSRQEYWSGVPLPSLSICIFTHKYVFALFIQKEMATDFSTLAWKIPWTEEPDRLQSMGSQRVRQD